MEGNTAGDERILAALKPGFKIMLVNDGLWSK
jgi:hypothetical protein